MRFCRYYSTFIQAHGVPNLSLEEHKRLFNIVSFENRYTVLDELSRKIPESNLQREIEVKKYRIREKLQKLTGNRYPKDIMQEMIKRTEMA